MRHAPILLFLLLLPSLAHAADYELQKVLSGNVYGVLYPFKSPTDVYGDPANDRFYIADSFAFAVHSYYFSNLSYISTLGGDASAAATEGGLGRPISMVARNNKLFVADIGQNRVKQYTTSFSFEKGSAVDSQTGVYSLSGAAGVDVAPNGTIYIADTGNNRILAYDSDFKYLFTIGGYGTFGDDALNTPHGLSISGNSLYVADTGNNRVKVLDLNGTFISTMGSGEDPLYRPEDVYAGADGLIYVADTLNNRIVIFSQNGNVYSTISGSYDAKPLNAPSGVYADIGGNVYVADTGNNRVLMLSPSGLLPAIATTASEAMANATTLIGSFNALLSASAGLPGVSANDGGAASYLEQASTKYAQHEYPGAFQDALEATSRVQASRTSLESQLNSSITSELGLLYSRFAAYDRNISAFKLNISTDEMRTAASKLNESLQALDYAAAVPSLRSLKSAADAFEANLKGNITDTQSTKQSLTSSISLLLSQTSDLKVQASLYRQELNTTVLDAGLSAAASQLSRNLGNSLEQYSAAKAEFDRLNSSLNSQIIAIIDANASITYAHGVMEQTANVSGLLSKPDLAKSLETLGEAERILYTDPALAKTLAGQAVQQAKAEEEKAMSSKEAVVSVLALLLVFLIVAIGVVYLVYRQRLSRRQQLLSAPPQMPPSAQPPPQNEAPMRPARPFLQKPSAGQKMPEKNAPAKKRK